MKDVGIPGPNYTAEPCASPRLERLSFGADVETILAILRRDGGLILQNALSTKDVATVNQELDHQMKAMPIGNWSFGNEGWVAEFQGYKTKRLQHCVRHSPTYRAKFLDSPTMAAYVSAILNTRHGSESLFASQAIEIYPGERAQILHRDAEPFHRRFDSFSSKSGEILVNTLLALTDVTEEMGATRVILGSHAWGDYDQSYGPQDTVAAPLNAGDLLLLTGRLLHGGGANVTKDRSRRVISTSWSLGFLKSEEAWHFAVPLDEAREYPEQVQRYLGLYSSSYKDEYPGFLWRVNAEPLEQYLRLSN